MTVKKLIKTWDFPEENRGRITLESNTRLVPDRHVIELVEGQTQGTFRTWTTNPQAARQWLLFQAVAQTPAGTYLEYQINDGSGDFYWNDSTNAWEAAGASDWSSEANIAANIATFDWTSRTLQIRVRLNGTATATPTVAALKVLYEARIYHQEDLIWRSLRRALRDGVRPLAEHVERISGGPATTIDISGFVDSTGYTIAEIESVTDRVADPDGLVDLFASYDAGTKTITLGTPIPDGGVAMINFTYQPLVAVTTDRLFNELAKVPAIEVNGIQEIDSGRVSYDDTVVDSSTGAGWRVKSPSFVDIEMNLRFVTAKAKDLTRLGEEVKRYFQRNPLLVSLGMDERYRLWMLDEPGGVVPQGQEQVYSGQVRVRIVKALYFERPAEPTQAVTSFTIR